MREALPADQHEDILQEVLLAIHLKRQTWRRDAPVRPWLYALARYKVVDAFRRRGARVTLPIEDFADVLPEEHAAQPLSARDADVMLGLIDTRSASLVRAVALDGKMIDAASERMARNVLVLADAFGATPSNAALAAVDGVQWRWWWGRSMAESAAR